MLKILGIKLSNIKRDDLIKNLEESLDKEEKVFISTPNPEIILNSHEDEELFYILNQSNYSLADGFGLQIAGLLSKQKFPRITGADFSLDLLKLAEKQEKKVLILNHENGRSKDSDIKKSLKKLFPELNFLVISEKPKIKLEKEKKEEVTSFSPEILFCLYGAPWQEKFIYHNLKDFNSLKIAIGVGGAFDFITKKAQRAPFVLRKIGLEWLWRLILEPKRLKRIFKATILFMIKVINWRFILPHKYRKNVACLLYRFKNKEKEILLVKRSDQKNHWQIPQGGLDNQKIIEAGKRELREEVGTSNFTVEKVFKNVFKYKFRDNFSSDKEKNKHYDKFGYKGQKQNLLIARFTGSDEDININFWDHTNWKWVKESEVLKIIHPVRRNATKKFLEKLNKLKYEKN